MQWKTAQFLFYEAAHGWYCRPSTVGLTVDLSEDEGATPTALVSTFTFAERGI